LDGEEGGMNVPEDTRRSEEFLHAFKNRKLGQTDLTWSVRVCHQRRQRQRGHQEKRGGRSRRV